MIHGGAAGTGAVVIRYDPVHVPRVGIVSPSYPRCCVFGHPPLRGPVTPLFTSALSLRPLLTQPQEHHSEAWPRRELLGVHKQRQEGLNWVGACVPAGRMHVSGAGRVKNGDMHLVSCHVMPKTMPHMIQLTGEWQRGVWHIA